MILVSTATVDKMYVLSRWTRYLHLIAWWRSPSGTLWFLARVFLVIAIKNYIDTITVIISEIRGYHLEVLFGELFKCGQAYAFFIICTTAIPSMTYAVDILSSTGGLGSACTCSLSIPRNTLLLVLLDNPSGWASAQETESSSYFNTSLK